MNVIAPKTLKAFWEQPGCGDAEGPLKSWLQEARIAKWSRWEDIKARYRSADWVGNNRVVFDIGGNKYRLIVRVNFASQTIFVVFIGTHEAYDRIEDVKEVRYGD